MITIDPIMAESGYPAQCENGHDFFFNLEIGRNAVEFDNHVLISCPVCGKTEKSRVLDLIDDPGDTFDMLSWDSL